jgi:hypothetical protein
MLSVTFSETLQQQFDPENAYRKLPVILKFVPEAGKDTYNTYIG